MPVTTPTSHETKLLAREEVAAGTMAFRFTRPEGFIFKAGQSIDVTLIDPPETDAEGDTRTFSIASAPYEPDLLIATRMRDTAFKRVLAKAAAGLSVRIEGPSGSFTLHKNAAKPAVFIAGGIGITPFRSIIRQAVFEKAPHSLYLFYANRRPEDAAFLDELEEAARAHASLKVIATMTEMTGSARTWTGQTGVITQDLLSLHVASLQGPTFYVAGPPAMVAALRDVLIASGVDEDDLRSEDFAGY